MDTLTLTPSQRIEPALTAQEKHDIRSSYLIWLSSELKNLPAPVKIKGKSVEIPLDRVFVALRGYPGSTSELRQATTLRAREDRYEEPSLWLERDVHGEFASNQTDPIDLGEAFQRHRMLVVLGDPGSGKTTLARRLALAFAEAGERSEAHVFVAENILDSNSCRPQQQVDLGASRLPIYVRIADLADEYRRRNKTGVLADLLGYGKYVASPVYNTGDARHGEQINPEHLTSVFKEALRDQRAVVFLDGLDEIANPEDRAALVKLVHGFLDSFFLPTGEPGISNQLVVTSRIIGYEEHPLRNDVSRYTIEPLSETMIGEFIDCWHAACAKDLAEKAQSPEDASRAASGSFKDQIFNPERAALRELASNPFMLSLLCVLNQEHDQKLPSSRAALYEMLVERGLNSLFVEKSDTNRKLRALISRVLMLLANRMHTTTSNGLLPRVEVEHIVWEAVSRDRAGAEAIESKEKAFRIVVQSVGLLDERGEGQFGFKHQTIQEFLAGKLLVVEKTTAAAEVMDRSTDPRWREAVLLGIGSLCQSLSQEDAAEVCRQIIAHKSSSVPSGALMLAHVIREFGPVPPEIVGATVETLLAPYEQFGTAKGTAPYNDFVELFVGDLLVKQSFPKAWRTATERACLQLGSDDGGGRHALARLLLSRRLAVSSMAAKLLATLYRDGDESDWVVHRTLEMMAMGDSRQATDYAPVTDTICRQLSLKTLETLRDPNVIDALRYIPRTRVKHQQREIEIAAHLLPFRQAVLQIAGAAEFIAGEVAWVRAVTLIYGGLGCFDATDLRDTLQEGRRSIRSSVSVRDDAERTARYLDTEVQPKWEQRKNNAPALNAKWIYADSPLTPLLVRLLRDRSPLDQAVPLLRDLWAKPDNPTAYSLAARYLETAAGARMTADEALEVLLAHTLIVLMACSKLDHATLLISDPAPLHERARRRFTSEMSRALTAVREPLLRSQSSLEKMLELGGVKDAAVAAERPGDASLDDEQPDPYAFPLASDRIAATKQLSDLWARIVRVDKPDATRQVADVLDCNGKRLSENPVALLASWFSFLDAARRHWYHPRAAEFACMMRDADDDDAFLSACFGGIDSLPAQFEFLKAFALSRSAAVINDFPQFKILAVSLANDLPTPIFRELALRSLRPGESFDRADVRSEIDLAAQTADPEHGIIAFRALRYAGGFEQKPRRRALLDCALRIPALRLRATSLMQTSIVFGSLEEGEVARELLAELLTQLENGNDAEIALILRNSETSEASTEGSFLTAFTEIGALLEELRGDMPTPLSFLGYQPHEQQGAFAAGYFRSLFLNDSDDREYGVAVALDTVGKKLNLAPPQLIDALARSLPLAEELRWDTSGFLSSVSLAAAERNAYLEALLFVAVLPAGFDSLAAWALSRISRFISLAVPQWAPLLAVLATRLADPHRALAMSGVNALYGKVVSDELPEVLTRSALAIEDPFARFQTLRIFRKAGMPVASRIILAAADQIRGSQQRTSALFDCVIECANEIVSEGGFSVIESAIDRCKPDTRNGLLSLLAVITRRRMTTTDTLQPLRIASAKIDRRISNGTQEILRSAEFAGAPLELETPAMRWLRSRTLHSNDPQTVAALALVLNALGAKRLLSLLPARRDTLTWAALARPEQRSEALSALAASGLRDGGLSFDEAVLTALVAWVERGDSVAGLEPVLPLVSGGHQIGTVQLEDWFARDSTGIIGQWACVMLAERDRWNETIVVTLIELLRHTNDLLRNRASMAVMMTGRVGRMARSSAVGEAALLALARASVKVTTVVLSDDLPLSPAIRTPIRWAFERLMVDSEGLLTKLRDDYARLGNGVAGALYRRLNYVSQPVRREIALLLTVGLPDELRTDLTYALVALWYRSWHRLPTDDPSVAQIRSTLWRTIEHNDAEVRYVAGTALGFMGSQEDIEQIAAAALEVSPRQGEWIRMLAASSMSPDAHSRKLLDAGGVLFQTLLDLLGQPDTNVSELAASLLLRVGALPVEVRDRMRNDRAFLAACFGSVDFQFIGDDFYSQVRRVARGIEQITSAQTEVHGISEDDLFVLALLKAYDAMAAGIWHYNYLDPPNNLCNILPLCAAAAEMMPDLYRRIVDDMLPATFPQLLAAAVSNGDSFTVREAGLVLLALLRRFSVHMSRALRAASSDVFSVQETAVRQISRLRQIDPDDPEAFSRLEELLVSPSANIVYVAMRIILGALRNEKLTANERRFLRERASVALSAAAQNIAPHKIVSLLESEDDLYTPRVRNVGFIGDVLDSALLELSSVYLGRTMDGQATSDVARIRVKTVASGEPRSFDLWVGERAANGLIPNQRVWVEKVLRLTIPQEVSETLSDLQQVASAARVSCAALAYHAQRLDIEMEGPTS